jgi:hypothetical protein
VPESVCGLVPGPLKVTPEGSEPVIESVGAGTPVAVMLKVPATPNVKVVLFALVIRGGTGVGCGVTLTVPEAALVSEYGAACVAVTEQV